LVAQGRLLVIGVVRRWRLLYTIWYSWECFCFPLSDSYATGPANKGFVFTVWYFQLFHQLLHQLGRWLAPARLDAPDGFGGTLDALG
jgi:hypothetical protein